MFAISYFTQPWNAYVTRNVPQTNKGEACLDQRQNTFAIKLNASLTVKLTLEAVNTFQYCSLRISMQSFSSKRVEPLEFYAGVTSQTNMAFDDGEFK